MVVDLRILVGKSFDEHIEYTEEEAWKLEAREQTTQIWNFYKKKSKTYKFTVAKMKKKNKKQGGIERFI